MFSESNKATCRPYPALQVAPTCRRSVTGYLTIWWRSPLVWGHLKSWKGNKENHRELIFHQRLFWQQPVNYLGVILIVDSNQAILLTFLLKNKFNRISFFQTLIPKVLSTRPQFSKVCCLKIVIFIPLHVSTHTNNRIT